LIAASADGKEIADLLAVRTGSALLGDVVGVSGSSMSHSVRRRVHRGGGVEG
jgi:electron transfer flavoprotein alpha subunit